MQFLELAYPMYGDNISGTDLIAKLSEPRHIKTHLNFEILQDALKNSKCKIVQVKYD